MKASQLKPFAKEAESLLQKLHYLESEMQRLQDSITAEVVSDSTCPKQLEFRNLFEQMVTGKQGFVKINCMIDLLQQILRDKDGHDAEVAFATESDKIEYELMLAEKTIRKIKHKINQLNFSVGKV